MGWGNSRKFHKIKQDGDLKVGFWNKGGAIQPLKEKINEIEYLIKSNGFSVFGVVEANFFANNDLHDIELSGYKLFWDKGRQNVQRKKC